MLATTRGDLYRGTPTEDIYGDEIEDNLGEIGHFEHVPTTYTPWAETRRNLHTQPRVPTISNGRWFVGGSVPGGRSISGEGFDGFPTAYRVTLTGSSPGVNVGIGTSMRDVAAVVDAFLSVHFFSSVPLLVRPAVERWSAPSGGSRGPNATAGDVMLAPGVTRLIIPVIFDPGFPYYTLVVYGATSDPIPAGAILAASGGMMDPIGGDYFDGSTLDAEFLRTYWAGTPGVSESVLETRAVDVPAHDVWVIDKPSAVVALDFALSIEEKTTREQDEASGTWRTVRYFAARIPSNIDIQYGDRIRDRRTGLFYSIDSIRSVPRSLAGRASTTLKLRRA